MRTVALIVAATDGPGSSDPVSADPGGSERAGGAGSDSARALLAPLAGRPVAEHAIAAFEAASEVDDVVLVARPALASGLRLGRGTRLAEAAGSRAESVLSAIEALGETDCHLLIHDAARPLVGLRLIADCAAALGSAQAVCAAVPASDTMVRVENGFITERPRRDRLRRREYPQGFHLPVIRRGYRLALADPAYRPTDDCGVVLRYLPGVPVRLVPGSEQSFPVTSPLDVDIAETILRARPA
jgi:2-C-methyl-D-erythritol 4-phosphate cytidylyltransferase